MMKIMLWGFFFATVFGCTSTRAVNAEQEEFDPAKSTPGEFLASLCDVSKPSRWVAIDDSVRGWVTEGDIPNLIASLDSNRPCRPVIKDISSYRPPSSTEGDEAALIIQSFRDGFYPNQLHSRVYSKVEKDEIRTWWRRFTAAKRFNQSTGRTKKN